MNEPLPGQQEFPLTLECAECWMPPPTHMHYCKHAKLTERQRMMS